MRLVKVSARALLAAGAPLAALLQMLLLSPMAATTASAQSAAPPKASSASVPAGFVVLDANSAPRGALATMVVLDGTRRARGAVLDDIAKQAKLSFAADPSRAELQATMAAAAGRMSARDALLRALDGSGLRAMVGPTGQVIVVPRTSDPARTRGDSTAQLLRLTGYIRSASSQEVVRHAVIDIGNTLASMTRRESNEEGFYVVMLASGTHRVQVRAIGFAPLDTTITVTGHASRDLVLRPRSVVLSAVKVEASKTERADLDPSLPDMSVNRLDLRTVRQAPAMLGEVDPLRSLTLLPGAATASDASTAFSVRGGHVDQNLILLDEATIYNPSHILGFISTFNADAVDDLTLYKGAIPAKFGGRLSSVVDVRQREGNATEFTGTASIGLLASRLLLEGPLPRKRGSYLIAARRSYADLFLPLASDTAVREGEAYFYDLNAKINLRVGQTGAVFFSTYIGRDKFGQKAEGIGAGWGNTSSTLRWNQAFGSLFSKVTATQSDYDYRLRFRLEPRDSAQLVAKIGTIGLKIDETWQFANRQSLSFGADIARHEFRPGSVKPLGDTTLIKPRQIETRHGLATAAYLEHEVELGSRIGVRYGLRFAAFDRRGPATRFRYENDAPVVYNAKLGRYEPGRLIDSTKLASGSSVAQFDGVEPRASMRFSLTPNHSLKASYARTQQFLQLVSNTNSTTPLDVWEPVGEWIDPQRADQVAVGYSGRHGPYEFTAEVYGKRARNVVDYIDGADLVFNPRLETLLVQGEGRATGLELLLRRTTGRMTGWASYTLARSEQRFPAPLRSGATQGGGVNDGAWYVSPYDKTHSLSLVGVYQWKPKWTLGTTFVMASGLPTTLPRARYELDGVLMADYGPRNGARLPLYHRLDISATRLLRRGELQFGFLNAYNRFNAQSLRVRQQKENPLIAEAVQSSIFGIVPSINYVFRF